MRPRYPIYIPSKGRADCCLTAQFLRKEGVDFFLVVEPQEHDAYAAAFGAACVLVLPFANLGLGSIPARNWIKAHSMARGDARHWQFDDNIQGVMRMYHGKRIRCASAPAICAVEDFTDRYTNVAVSGMNYTMWIGLQPHREPPFLLNCRVYSCSLVLNAIPHSWRGRYNEDTDLCLQVLSDGWCTILVNAFLIQKVRTMTMKGGNAAELYQGDGRLKMARALERVWPGVVTTKRRFDRPQHVVKDAWRRFDNALMLKAGIDLTALGANEYGLTLKALKPVKSDDLKALIEKPRGRRIEEA